MDRITEDVKQIIKVLTDSGHEAYIVGGAVRDILFGRKEVIKDIDITTSAQPNEIETLFKDKGYNTSCGNSFLVSLVNGYEIATFRKDKADSAVIAFSLEEDVMRRDFTINAIALDIKDNSIIDYTHGTEDIEDRILRFINNPTERILEDPVRILRGLRFAAKYNLTIEEETFFAMAKYSYLIKSLPKERIVLEIEKAFKTENAYRFLTLLDEINLLEIIFPTLCRLKEVDGGKHHNETVFQHSLYAVKALDKTKNFKLKLAALYHDIGKLRFQYDLITENITFYSHEKESLPFIERDLREHLGLPNDIVNYVSNISLLHMSNTDNSKQIKRLNIALFARSLSLKNFFYMRYADKKANLKKQNVSFIDIAKQYKESLKAIRVNEEPVSGIKSLKVDGCDVMRTLGIPAGIEVGAALRNLLELVVEEKIENTRESLLNQLACMVKV